MKDETANNNKSYAAFISYSEENSRESENWQLWLQEQIASYPISVNVYKAAKNKDVFNERKLKPVYLDKTDLAPAECLTAELRGALQDSIALIVLCSSRAIESDWVDEEIRFFKKNNPNAPIIPVVVESELSEQNTDYASFFPKALSDINKGYEEDKFNEPKAVDFRLTVAGKKSRGFTQATDALEYYRPITKLTKQQTLQDCLEYEKLKRDNIRKIMSVILDAEPTLLKTEDPLKIDESIFPQSTTWAKNPLTYMVAGLLIIAAGFTAYQFSYETLPANYCHVDRDIAMLKAEAELGRQVKQLLEQNTNYIKETAPNQEQLKEIIASKTKAILNGPRDTNKYRNEYGEHCVDIRLKYRPVTR